MPAQELERMAGDPDGSLIPQRTWLEHICFLALAACHALPVGGAPGLWLVLGFGPSLEISSTPLQSPRDSQSLWGGGVRCLSLGSLVYLLNLEVPAVPREMRPDCGILQTKLGAPYLH